ncbi:hypothetical protein J6590_051145 [Homalodisca vitripennis]|nr:hypothetical protein J6590_051145 [Homalodisca vitripennis]
MTQQWMGLALLPWHKSDPTFSRECFPVMRLGKARTQVFTQETEEVSENAVFNQKSYLLCFEMLKECIAKHSETTDVRYKTRMVLDREFSIICHWSGFGPEQLTSVPSDKNVALAELAGGTFLQRELKNTYCTLADPHGANLLRSFLDFGSFTECPPGLRTRGWKFLDRWTPVVCTEEPFPPRNSVRPPSADKDERAFRAPGLERTLDEEEPELVPVELPPGFDGFWASRFAFCNSTLHLGKKVRSGQIQGSVVAQHVKTSLCFNKLTVNNKLLSNPLEKIYMEVTWLQKRYALRFENISYDSLATASFLEIVLTQQTSHSLKISLFCDGAEYGGYWSFVTDNV